MDQLFGLQHRSRTDPMISQRKIGLTKRQPEIFVVPPIAGARPRVLS